MSIQIIMASHGSLAEGMKSAVKMIAGDYANLHAFGLDTYATPDCIGDEVDKIMVANPESVFIILCDIKCGSVHNKLIQNCNKENVCLISGINLALVLTLILTNEDKINRETILSIMEEAKENMMYFDKETIYKENNKEDDLW